MLWLTAALCLAAPPSPAAYALFNGEGRAVPFSALAEAMAGADVAFFGESHSDPIAHWLERELTAALFASKGAQLLLGAEMLERDQQLILDEYLADTVRDKDFTAGTRLWPNYATDYAPLVDFAKAHRLRFVATNVPRRYAATVARGGLPALDGLSAAAKALFAPLPLTVDLSLPAYKAMLAMVAHGGPMKPEFLAQAQALKDATMADSIHRALPAGGTLLHFNGSYHSEGHEGIVWYLRRLRPTVRVVTLATTAQPELAALAPDHRGVADFVLVTPATMTQTQPAS